MIKVICILNPETNEKYISNSFFSEELSGGSSAWQSFRISLSEADGDAVDITHPSDVTQPAKHTETGVSQES